jgi:hypothetical protein
MRHEAPGLPADWLNGWLAAIGVTVLVPGARLCWTDDGVPSAVFETAQLADLPKVVADALPTPETLARSAIARRLPETEHDFGRNVTLAAFQERAAIGRRVGEGILAASVSDLSADLKPDNLEHGAFDAPAPRGETLWSRATACAQALATADIAQRVRATFEGSGRREALNGLGFDARRFPAGMHAARDVYADPVVELLAFTAFPCSRPGETADGSGSASGQTAAPGEGPFSGSRGGQPWTAGRSTRYSTSHHGTSAG